MRGPSARGLAAATVAVLGFAGAVGWPRAAGEAPQLPRAEVWISTACGGEEPCERWQEVRRLSDLLDERMEAEAEERLRLATAISSEAAQAGLDPLFVLAVIEVESGFDAGAVSHRGARGLMQLRPATFQREVERHNLDSGDPADPVVNVRAGVRYYARLLRDFRQNHELALMAYNAGPQRISKLRREDGGIPERFRAYPRRVDAELRRLRGERRVAAMAGSQPPRTAMR